MRTKIINQIAEKKMMEVTYINMTLLYMGVSYELIQTYFTTKNLSFIFSDFSPIVRAIFNKFHSKTRTVYNKKKAYEG